jgi:hypothetical protein
VETAGNGNGSGRSAVPDVVMPPLAVLCVDNLIASKPLFLPTRLVTIAALLRRYSPSPHHHLSLYLGYLVTSLLSLLLTNHNLLTIRLYYAKVVNSIRLLRIFEGIKVSKV